MITVIITAYNIEQFIEKAIQSCIDQTYQDLEILIINDCSTDGTLEVIQSFADPRIRVISNEVNLGAGMSRRIGTKEAKGEYTIFLDGDDYLNLDFVETLLNAAKKYNADIVSSGINIIKGAFSDTVTYETETVLSSLEFLQDTQQEKHLINIYLNNKLVSRKLWDIVDYSDRRYVEDTQSCFFVTFFSKTIACIPYSGYNYNQRNTSLSHTSSPIKNLLYQALCAKDVCEFIVINHPESIQEALLAFVARIKNLCQIELPDSIRDDYKNELAELFTFFLQNITL